MKKIVKIALKIVVLLWGILFLIQILLLSEIFINQKKELKIEKVGKDQYKASIGIRSINLSIKKDTSNNYDIEITKFPDFSFGDGLYYFNQYIGYETKATRKEKDIYSISHSYEADIPGYILRFYRLRKEVTFTIGLNEKNIDQSIIVYELK